MKIMFKTSGKYANKRRMPKHIKKLRNFSETDRQLINDWLDHVYGILPIDKQLHVQYVTTSKEIVKRTLEPIAPWRAVLSKYHG